MNTCKKTMPGKWHGIVLALVGACKQKNNTFGGRMVLFIRSIPVVSRIAIMTGSGTSRALYVAWII
jgi:hypothetical protein